MSTELVKKNLGEGPRLVREIFKFAKTKEPCIIFIDEVTLLLANCFTTFFIHVVQQMFLIL